MSVRARWDTKLQVYRICFCCDVCEGEITEARLAMVVWRIQSGDKSSEWDCEIVHKGECAGPRELSEHFDELTAAWWYLAANANIDPDKAERAAAAANFVSVENSGRAKGKKKAQPEDSIVIRIVKAIELMALALCTIAVAAGRRR